LPNYNTGDWIELQNPNNTNINIGNYTIKTKTGNSTLPLQTTIPANNYLVLVQNKNLFNTIFPTVINTLELNSLNILDADRIEIYDSIGNIFYYVGFDTITPWPLTLTKGYTLEYADTAHNPWQVSNWFAGCFAGSPGKKYSLPCGINGIDKTENKLPKLYPNPNSGSFTLYSLLAGSVSVFDMNGKIIFHGDIQPGINTITLNCSKGIYILNLSNGNEIFRKKLIVE
jgi:hypothetical protein